MYATVMFKGIAAMDWRGNRMHMGSVGKKTEGRK